MHVPVVSQFMGGVHLHVRTPFLYLGNGWTHRAEICYVARDLPAMRFTQVMGGVNLHARTRALVFHISEINGLVVLRFDVLLESH